MEKRDPSYETEREKLMSKFEIQDIVQLQTMVFPLIKMLGGPDVPEDILKPTSANLFRVGVVLKESTDVVMEAAQALDDGHLSLDEINAIIGEAVDVKEAIDRLRHGGSETEEPRGDR